MFIKALTQLVLFDLRLFRGDFAALHRCVQDWPVANRPVDRNMVERICSAVDLACVWYPKHALCLQRSAATVCLLRSCGVPAQMVIGVQKLPFKAHAWVEVNGIVVNDKPYVPEIYAVLDRC